MLLDTRPFSQDSVNSIPMFGLLLGDESALRTGPAQAGPCLLGGKTHYLYNVAASSAAKLA